jgi:hypothetical protein
MELFKSTTATRKASVAELGSQSQKCGGGGGGHRTRDKERGILG